jgi:hypothetical protein
MTVPVEPGREQARAWALEELAKREYRDARPGLVERVFTWALEQLQRVGNVDRPVSFALLAVISVVLVVLAVWGVNRAGGLRRAARLRAAPVLTDPGTTAAEHRATAERLAAAGDWDGAVLHRFRAIAKTLEDEAILAPQPGRTADEVAREAGRRLPDLAADLLAGARLFDDVHYGDRHVGAAAADRLRALDDTVRRARVAGLP